VLQQQEGSVWKAVEDLIVVVQLEALHVSTVRNASMIYDLYAKIRRRINQPNSEGFKSSKSF
jgi:tRNA U54 and U55 pseudouridine synthase Pus10